MKKDMEKKRRFPSIGVRFACCNRYVRLYMSPERKRYVLHCPHCGKKAVFEKDPDAPEVDFFEVG